MPICQSINDEKLLVFSILVPGISAFVTVACFSISSPMKTICMKKIFTPLLGGISYPAFCFTASSQQH